MLTLIIVMIFALWFIGQVFTAEAAVIAAVPILLMLFVNLFNKIMARVSKRPLTESTIITVFIIASLGIALCVALIQAGIIK